MKATQSAPALQPVVCFQPPGTSRNEPAGNSLAEAASAPPTSVPEITTTFTSALCVCWSCIMPAGNFTNPLNAPLVLSPAAGATMTPPESFISAHFTSAAGSSIGDFAFFGLAAGFAASAGLAASSANAADV